MACILSLTDAACPCRHRTTLNPHLRVVHLGEEILERVRSHLVLEPRLVEGVRHSLVGLGVDAPATTINHRKCDSKVCTTDSRSSHGAGSIHGSITCNSNGVPWSALNHVPSLCLLLCCTSRLFCVVAQSPTGAKLAWEGEPKNDDTLSAACHPRTFWPKARAGRRTATGNTQTRRQSPHFYQARRTHFGNFPQSTPDVPLDIHTCPFPVPP